jgi:hypothetical protein
LTSEYNHTYHEGTFTLRTNEVSVAHARFVSKSLSDLTTTAFDSAEEAWFWFVRCQQVRREGAHLGDGPGQITRPCDPDDIYCAVMVLSRRGMLAGPHLEVLGKFGLTGRPPDARRSDEATASRLWTEALERLAVVLRAKGIVA